MVTTRKSTLKEHKLKKHPIGGEHVNVIRCLYEGCTHQTMYKSTLKYHIESKHEGIVRFRCQNMNCSFGTNQQKRLKEHTRGHNKEKQYKCQMCDFKYTRRESLDKHLTGHGGENVFKSNGFKKD